ncbi:hypothetical protein LguiA_009783 [Lonicera macranthoides]
MVMMCFVLDLRNLWPKLLRDLKQSLLQLANFYAISDQFSERSHSKSLCDRIGLCYVHKNRISRSNELKIAYTPRGNFSLRDFHHAVNNLPTDAFLPEITDAGALCCDDMKLSSVLSKKVLYSWVGHEKDIAKKVILISSCLADLDSVTKEALMDAADKCVSVEFFLLEQKSSHLGDLPDKINNFIKHICDLENCSFQTLLPDAKIWCFLVKRWLQELKDDMEEQLQARFIFKNNLAGSLNQIYCNLCPSFIPIMDGFIPCRTCRCHGFVIDDERGNKMQRCSCPVTGNDLGEFDLVENSVEVGKQTILFMPSFQSCMKHLQVSSQIDFNVIERTNLGSLSEGFIFGSSYIVTPSICQESDDIDKSEINTQIFLGLCSALNSLDQGLVCSSNSNVESARETSFQCYYILLPSDKGLMLLRRLAGSEEVLPVPDVSQLLDSTVTKEIENSVQASLLKMEATDYNPVLHERGFHQRLNLLVKESLQFGSLPPKLKDIISEPNSTQRNSSERAGSSTQATEVLEEEEITELELEAEEGKTTAHITDEWEQLIINEVPKLQSPTFTIEPSTQRDSSETDVVLIEVEMTESKPKDGADKTNERIAEEWERLIITEVPEKYSPNCIVRPKLDQPMLSQPESNKKLDEKTSRILERLEVPRQLKTKAGSPTISSSGKIDVCMTKKPLIPFGPLNTTQDTMPSQPMKPNFHRLKRKQR